MQQIFVEHLEHRLFLNAPTTTNGLIHVARTIPSLEANFVGATGVGDLAIYAGGASGVGPRGRSRISKAINIYNVRSGLWSTAELPEPQERLSATSVGSLALFAGGDSPGSLSAAVDIYHSRTGRWSSARLSQARDFPTADSIGDVAIFAGGGPQLFFDLSSVIDVFNDGTGQWSTATLSQARQLMTVVNVGDKAIFAGGEYSTGSGFLVSNAVDIYDADTGQWTTSQLPRIGDSLSGTTVGNLALFAVGGTNIVDVYNASTNQWSTATLSQSRDSVVAATVGNLAIFAGGLVNDSTPTGAVDIYNATTNQWSTGQLPVAQTVVSAAVLGDKVIFTPGMVEKRHALVLSKLAEIYDAATGQWSTQALGQGGNGGYNVVRGTTALVAGGTAPTGINSNVVDLFTTPSLSGVASAPRHNIVSVTLSNTGASALPAPDSVAVYASKSRALDSSAVLLGSVRVRNPLAAGASEEVSIPITISAELAAGQYHLIAAAGPPHQLTQFASQRHTFTVGAVASLTPRDVAMPLIVPQSALFATGAARDHSVFDDPSDSIDESAQP